MKIEINESLESWAERVAIFEKSRAMKKIANGSDLEEVIETMSRRIMDKMLHPILNSIHASTSSTYDLENDRQQYDEIMKHIGKAADHVDTNT